VNRYRAYGLRITSDCALQFAPARFDGAGDLCVIFAGVSNAPAAPGQSDRALTRDDSGWCLTYANVARQWVAYRWDAADARLTIGTNQNWAACEYPLTGVVMAVLLALSGRTVLHGAALAVNGRALVLLGDSGHGKSTLAAALIARGASLLTDDVVRLQRGDDGYRATAGVPRLSLDGDAVKRLIARVPAVAVRVERHDRAKTLVEVPGAAETVPVGVIVQLAPIGAPDAACTLTPLAPTSAALAVARNIYGAAWIRALDAAHLADCAALAAIMPTFRLDRPHALNRLETTCDLLCGALA
jgi:hypothetical protein